MTIDLSNPNKTPFGEMSQVEQWALMGAAADGAVVEIYSCGMWFKIGWPPQWFKSDTYRLRPEPKRERVTMVGRVPTPPDSWAFHLGKEYVRDTHRITFDTIDGKPDCASIRMEEL